jgi:hypothetical protein
MSILSTDISSKDNWWYYFIMILSGDVYAHIFIISTGNGNYSAYISYWSCRQIYSEAHKRHGFHRNLIERYFMFIFSTDISSPSCRSCRQIFRRKIIGDIILSWSYREMCMRIYLSYQQVMVIIQHIFHIDLVDIYIVKRIRDMGFIEISSKDISCLSFQQIFHCDLIERFILSTVTVFI